MCVQCSHFTSRHFRCVSYLIQGEEITQQDVKNCFLPHFSMHVRIPDNFRIHMHPGQHEADSEEEMTRFCVTSNRKCNSAPGCSFIQSGNHKKTTERETLDVRNVAS